MSEERLEDTQTRLCYDRGLEQNDRKVGHLVNFETLDLFVSM
jgi:hypothetical protein